MSSNKTRSPFSTERFLRRTTTRYVLRPASGLRRHVVLRLTPQRFPSRFLQVLRDFDEVGHGVDPEEKANTVGVPFIQAAALRKVRVSAKKNLPKPSAPTQLDGPVHVRTGVLVRGTIPRTIHQVERLLGIG